jgi:hypothetical protein
MTSPGPDLIYCPLCNLPHRMGAVRCDGCDQALHEPVDLGQVRDERAARKQDMTLALVMIVALLVLNLALGGYVGGFILPLAPLGWLIRSWIRLRATTQRLARVSGR